MGRAARRRSSTPSYAPVRALAVSLMLSLVLVGCGATETSSDSAPTPPAPAPSEPGSAAEAVEQRYPDIVAVELVPVGDQIYDVTVTVSSPYDTAERYADGWRVLAPDGTVLGEHQLLHDHANEQPFTRTQRGVPVPADVKQVVVEGRDQANGYGGRTLAAEVPPTPPA